MQCILDQTFQLKLENYFGRHTLSLFNYVLQKDAVTNICQAADKQLFTLVEWAKRVPHFTELPLDDQVILLRAGKRLYF